MTTNAKSPRELRRQALRHPRLDETHPLLSFEFIPIDDQSGRGIAVTLPLSEVRERFDLSFSNDLENELEETLGDWLELADVGDTFANEEDHFTFTRVE